MKKKVTNLSLKIFTLFVISISLSINSNAQGNALNFDGINDYVPIGPSTGLYNAGAYAYTKEAWVLFLPVAQAQNIVSSYDPFFIEYDLILQ